MNYAVFEIELEQPVIISKQAASAGAHQSLDYIPGAALLGLAASRLYADLPKDQAWILFHSGQVRFGDGLPHGGGETGLPVPISLHHYKGESAADDRVLRAASLFDPALFTVDSQRQPVQMRGGYTTASGRQLRPGNLQVLKTAIDRDTGMAAESQLFGYSALAAGQRFRFELRADADVTPELWQQVLKRLQGRARLGRSRSAQFGRVSIRVVDGAQPPAPPECRGTDLTLWLLSDLLLSEHGQPCQIPHPHLLGLPQGSEWLPERSFLRGRRYSSYNGYRRRYDSERQVIERGSVLRFKLSRALSADERSALQNGLGLMAECGLGAAAVNPALLAGERPQFSAPQALKAAEKTQPTGAEPALIGLLEARRQRRIGDIGPEDTARKLFKALCKRVADARTYNGATPGAPMDPAPPSRSQWGLIKQAASDCRGNATQLSQRLTQGENCLIRERSGWQLRYGSEPHEQLFLWMNTELQKHADTADFDRIVGHLAAFGLQDEWTRCCEGTEKPRAQHEQQEQTQ